VKRSTDRILTTHVGSLIRPPELLEFLSAKRDRRPVDEGAYARCLKDTVAGIVRRQAEAGVDVPSDGEFGKSISWSQYLLERMSGFERRPVAPGANPFARGADRTRFAEFYAELDAKEGFATATESVCVGPIAYTGQAALQRDIDNFKAALKGVRVAEAMRTEYRTIVDAGFVVQLDDARAAVTYDRMVPPNTFADYRSWLARHVEVMNHALEGIPRDRVRYHVCWGSWPGPHTTDVPLKDIVDLVVKARVGALVIEGANPRHEHEWRVWEHVKLPPDTVLIPGVISHATNIVEHPELVAERIVRLARLVGRENVIAGTDCGFAQGPFYRRVHPSIMWAKLEALAEGARLATKALWA